ncbi:MAG: anti-sigma factor family protein [Candidatus Binataceae bacterium]
MKIESKAAACEKYEALLEDSLAGESTGGDARRVAEHVKCCEGCRTALETARASGVLLRMAAKLAAPAPYPGPGFERVMMARIRAHREREERNGIWQPLVFLASRMAISATLALGLLLAYDVTWHTGNAANVATMRAAQPGDLLGDSVKLPANRDDVLMMVAENDHGKH